MRRIKNILTLIIQKTWLILLWFLRTIRFVIFIITKWIVTNFKIITIILTIFFVILISFSLRANIVMTKMAKKIYFDVDSAPTSSVALVFGAGLTRTGVPSAVLADRVETAVELYKAGKVKKILMTGDNGRVSYDEVTAMKKLAIEKGVPVENITLDYAGFRTYDSCYRAKAIFGVEDVIAVSQYFHLPRIIYLCEARGIKTIGIVADKREYQFANVWDRREFIARAITWVEVNITKPKPKYLGKYEPIFSETK